MTEVDRALIYWTASTHRRRCPVRSRFVNGTSPPSLGRSVGRPSVGSTNIRTIRDTIATSQSSGEHTLTSADSCHFPAKKHRGNRILTAIKTWTFCKTTAAFHRQKNLSRTAKNGGLNGVSVKKSHNERRLTMTSSATAQHRSQHRILDRISVLLHDVNVGYRLRVPTIPTTPTNRTTTTLSICRFQWHDDIVAKRQTNCNVNNIVWR